MRQPAPKSEQVVLRNYMFCSTKIYSFEVQNNVENVTCKIRILYGTEKKIRDTLFTYIACSSSCSSAVETDYMIWTIYTWMDVTTRSSDMSGVFVINRRQFAVITGCHINVQGREFFR